MRVRVRASHHGLQHLRVDAELCHRLGRLEHLLHLGRLHQLPQELGVLEQALQHRRVLGKRRRQPRGKPAATAAAAATTAAAERQRRGGGRGGRSSRRLVQDGRERLRVALDELELAGVALLERGEVLLQLRLVGSGLGLV